MLKTALVVASLSLATVGAGAGSAMAAAPDIERGPIAESFEDELLSEACGFPVEVTIEGFFINRAFEREGVGPKNVFTLNATATFTAGDNSVSLKDVGGDFLRTTPDGDVILTIVGKVPFWFNGAFKVNTVTNEVLLEPRNIGEQQAAEVCAVLDPEG